MRLPPGLARGVGRRSPLLPRPPRPHTGRCSQPAASAAPPGEPRACSAGGGREPCAFFGGVISLPCFFFFFPFPEKGRPRRRPAVPGGVRAEPEPEPEPGGMPLVRGKVVLLLGFVFLTTLLAALRGLPVRRQRGSSPRERSPKLAEVRGRRGSGGGPPGRDPHLGGEGTPGCLGRAAPSWSPSLESWAGRAGLQMPPEECCRWRGCRGTVTPAEPPGATPAAPAGRTELLAARQGSNKCGNASAARGARRQPEGHGLCPACCGPGCCGEREMQAGPAGMLHGTALPTPRRCFWGNSKQKCGRHQGDARLDVLGLLGCRAGVYA